MVTTGCIIVLEISYKMDFSLLGFLLCSVILGFGEFRGLISMTEFPIFFSYFSFSIMTNAISF
jgi:hypothetical protein